VGHAVGTTESPVHHERALGGRSDGRLSLDLLEVRDWSLGFAFDGDVAPTIRTCHPVPRTVWPVALLAGTVGFTALIAFVSVMARLAVLP